MQDINFFSALGYARKRCASPLSEKSRIADNGYSVVQNFRPLAEHAPFRISFEMTHTSNSELLYLWLLPLSLPFINNAIVLNFNAKDISNSVTIRNICILTMQKLWRFEVDCASRCYASKSVMTRRNQRSIHGKSVVICIS